MKKKILLASLAMGALASTEARAEPTNVISGMINLCLDVAGANRSSGATLITWFCHSGSNQKLQFMPNGEIRVYGNKCLDAFGGQGRNGDRIGIWDCHGGANQRWTRTAQGEIRGINNRCIDIKGAWPAPGAEIILWDCHGGSNQKWAAVGFSRPIQATGRNPIPSTAISQRIAQSNGSARFTMPIGNNLANVTPLTQVTP